MRKPLRYMFFVLVATFLASVCATAGQDYAANVVQGSGSDREAAVQSALQAAVLKVAQAYLRTDAAAAGKLMSVQSTLFRDTGELIEDYDVLGESGGGPEPYKVKLKVWVRIRPVRNAMIATDIRKLPKVMVILPEYHLRRFVPDPAGQTEVVRLLIKNGFTVVDKEMSDQARRDEKVRQAVPGDPAKLGAAIRAAGSPPAKRGAKSKTARAKPRRLTADVLVVGEAFSETADRRSTAAGTQYSCGARVEVRAVDLPTCGVICSDAAHATAWDVGDALAGKSALRRAALALCQGSAATQSFIETLIDLLWKPEGLARCASPKDRIAIAVAPFMDHVRFPDGSSQRLGEDCARALKICLSKTGCFNVVERDEEQQRLDAEQQRQWLSGDFDVTAGVAIGQRLAAQYVVQCSLEKLETAPNPPRIRFSTMLDVGDVQKAVKKHSEILTTDKYGTYDVYTEAINAMAQHLAFTIQDKLVGITVECITEKGGDRVKEEGAEGDYATLNAGTYCGLFKQSSWKIVRTEEHSGKREVGWLLIEEADDSTCKGQIAANSVPVKRGDRITLADKPIPGMRSAGVVYAKPDDVESWLLDSGSASAGTDSDSRRSVLCRLHVWLGATYLPRKDSEPSRAAEEFDRAASISPKCRAVAQIQPANGKDVAPGVELPLDPYLSALSEMDNTMDSQSLFAEPLRKMRVLALIGYGRYLETGPRLDEAATRYQAATALAPQELEPRLALCECLAKLGETNALAPAIGEALSLFPDNPDLRAAVTRYNTAFGDLVAPMIRVDEKSIEVSRVGGGVRIRVTASVIDDAGLRQVTPYLRCSQNDPEIAGDKLLFGRGAGFVPAQIDETWENIGDLKYGAVLILKAADWSGRISAATIPLKKSRTQ